MRQDLCLCATMPRIETRTRVIILVHYLELNTSTNTGRLVHLALPNSDLRLRGLPGERTRTEDLCLPGERTLLLYPGPGSIELTSEYVDSLVSSKERVTLVVPDGSWRQAAKVQHREPGLAAATRVRLPTGQKPSEFVLRKEPNAEAVCTLEAIARSLGVLEGERGPEVQAMLEALLRKMIRRTLYSRGLLSAEQVAPDLS